MLCCLLRWCAGCLPGVRCIDFHTCNKWRGFVCCGEPTAQSCWAQEPGMAIIIQAVRDRAQEFYLQAGRSYSMSRKRWMCYDRWLRIHLSGTPPAGRPGRTNSKKEVRRRSRHQRKKRLNKPKYETRPRGQMAGRRGTGDGGGGRGNIIGHCGRRVSLMRRYGNMACCSGPRVRFALDMTAQPSSPARPTFTFMWVRSRL